MVSVKLWRSLEFPQANDSKVQANDNNNDRSEAK